MIPGPVETARAAWGDALPDWVEALALACSRTSQAAVARQLGRTGAVVSQVLRNSYPAKLDRIEERVRGVLMAFEVDCPGMGPIKTDVCQDWRAKATRFSYSSPTRRRMYRACHKCPRFVKEADE